MFEKIRNLRVGDTMITCEKSKMFESSRGRDVQR